jgi:ABC-type branched-subunit amino acid transport system substrate-binding protein
MGMKGRILAIVAGAAVVASIAVTAASGAQRLDPGVTSSSIKIGGTFPLTGPASLYKTIPVAEKAYFDYINDHGGVNGRKIDFTILDDAYDPSKTVSLTQQLVEQDKVFAVFGSLGTAQNLAVWNYVNQKKVPEVLLATGDSYWGFSAKKYPWTIGFQPDYPGEAKIYGKYIVKNLPSAKIGVLYQNDSFGKNSFAGLRVGLGAKKSQIVSAQPFDLSVGSVTSQVLALKASGADTFVLFATPTPAIQGLATAAKVGWSPAHTFINNVAAVSTFIKIAASSGAKVDGAISTGYLVDATIASEANLPGVALGKKILAQYAPTLDPNNQLSYYGLSTAWTMVYALKNAGKTPTRAGLMRALKNLNPAKAKNPFLYPGVKLKTGPHDNFPIEAQILVKWSGGATGGWTTFGNVYDNSR